MSPPDRRDRGRPEFRWSDDIETEILDRITKGETLRQICRDEHMPSTFTVYKMRSNRPDFARAYARARDAQLEAWEDELLDIAEDGTTDWVDREVARGRIERQPDREHIERSKLRIDAKKWIMSKRAPQRYGDALRIEGEMTHKAVIKAEPMSAEDWAKKHGATVIEAQPVEAIPGVIGRGPEPAPARQDEPPAFTPDPGKGRIG
jgi:hypothetical protein